MPSKKAKDAAADDERYPSDDDESEDFRRSSEGSAFSFEHVEICPLEAQCNPLLDGTFDKAAVLQRVANLSAQELASISELCMCVKGCKYRKCVDSDAAWWPHCAAAWYEPGMAPEKPGKPPKQRKTWKNAYLALRPEVGRRGCTTDCIVRGRVYTSADTRAHAHTLVGRKRLDVSTLKRWNGLLCIFMNTL